MTAAGSLSVPPVPEVPTSDPPAADFFSLVERAVVALVEPTPENRNAVYHLARTALDRQLLADLLTEGALDPGSEIAALDAAIVRVEAKFADPFDQALAAAPNVRTGPSGLRQFAFNAAASGVVNILKTLLQVALLPVMARLLGPASFGIYSLALPTVLFFTLLADGGLGVSLSREDESNRVIWSSAFWLLLGTCTVMGLGVVGSGVLLAWASGQPSLVGLMSFLALSLPLLAISVPPDARLQRRGNLLYHSGSDLIGSMLGAGVALTLAFKGAGAWALAAQYVTTFTIRAAILNAAAWSPPDLVFDFGSLRGHAANGGALLVGRIGELLCKLGENAAFGSVFGAAQLGSYTLANQVSRFACESVTNPVIGAFYSHALREDRDIVMALHAKLTRILMLVLLPATMLMAVAAPDMFPLILGDKWVEAAPIFQPIVVAYAISAASWLSGQILLKHGMADRAAKVMIGFGVCRVAAVATGLWLSPVMVAWLVGGTYALQGAVTTLIVPKGYGTSLRSLAATLLGSAVAAVAGASVSLVVLAHTPGSLSWGVAAGVLGVSSYVALLFLLDRRAVLADIAGLIQVIKRKSV